jgi:hypothetical protein
MVMPYAIMPKNMCQNIKCNTRYDSLSIALTCMSVATLYVGHLRMVKLLECLLYHLKLWHQNMLMVCYFTVLLRVEVRRELEFAYARGRLLVFGIREVSTPVGLPCCQPRTFVLNTRSLHLRLVVLETLLPLVCTRAMYPLQLDARANDPHVSLPAVELASSRLYIT